MKVTVNTVQGEFFSADSCVTMVSEPGSPSTTLLAHSLSGSPQQCAVTMGDKISRVKLSQVPSSLSHSPPRLSQASYSTSLNLIFLFSKMGTISVHPSEV